jgi:MFS family permease
LREREFRLLFLASTVTRLGSAMAPIALAFGVLNLTGSVSDLGFVLAAGSVPFVAFVLVGGVWADRISRLRVMAATGAVATVSQAVTAVLFLGGSARVWELMVLAALQGTARAFGGPAMGALIPDTISPARLQQATALLYMSASTVNIGGAAAGGLLVAAIGPGWTMLFNAATSLAEVAIRYLMRVDESAHVAGERRRSGTKSARSAVRVHGASSNPDTASERWWEARSCSGCVRRARSSPRRCSICSSSRPWRPSRWRHRSSSSLSPRSSAEPRTTRTWFSSTPPFSGWCRARCWRA